MSITTSEANSLLESKPEIPSISESDRSEESYGDDIPELIDDLSEDLDEMEVEGLKDFYGVMKWSGFDSERASDIVEDGHVVLSYGLRNSEDFEDRDHFYQATRDIYEKALEVESHPENEEIERELQSAYSWMNSSIQQARRSEEFNPPSDTGMASY